MTKVQVLWAPYRRMREAARECASGRDGPGMLLQQPGVGAVVATRSAIRSSLGRETAEIASPLGSDTEDILVGTLGLTNSRELGHLIDRGVVGAWPRSIPWSLRALNPVTSGVSPTWDAPGQNWAGHLLVVIRAQLSPKALRHSASSRLVGSMPIE
jgi:hypothetical protein